MKKFGLAAIGECLIDLVPSGVNELNVPLFSANPGGAPANVLAMYSKLGGETAFIGKVGNDGFGLSLIDNLKRANINTGSVVIDNEHNTTLAIVHLSETGNRSFSFYRHTEADVMLRSEEVNAETVKNSSVFHFGSVSLTDEPSRSATLTAVKLAKDSGALISYDPNYRPLLWNDINEAKEVMRGGALLADIIKVSDEELTLLTDETDLLRGAEKLLSFGISLVFVTLGENGAFYCNKKAQGALPAYDVKTIDTTGAGDTFFGSVLWLLSGKTKEQLSDLTDSELQDIVKFGNAAGSLATTKKGAIPAMPSKSEITTLVGRPVIVDMHTHSEYSHDSVCPIKDMVECQKLKGTAIFAVTDHCDIEYFETQDPEKLISDSVSDAERTNAETDGVGILRGVEIGEGIWHPDITKKIVSLTEYDVIIGSVHAVRFENYTMPYSTIKFSELGLDASERYFNNYFDDMLEMINSTEFDVLAHLTCPLRYINGKYGLGVDCKKYKDKITDILQSIIEKNIALEINTSCIGSAYNEFLPEEWIVALYKELGGSLVTLGSDAHIAENASHCFDEAVKMLKRNGFDRAYYYKNRRAYSYNI